MKVERLGKAEASPSRNRKTNYLKRSPAHRGLSPDAVVPYQEKHCEKSQGKVRGRPLYASLVRLSRHMHIIAESYVDRLIRTGKLFARIYAAKATLCYPSTFISGRQWVSRRR